MTRTKGTAAREATEVRLLRALQHGAVLDAEALSERLGVHKTTIYAAARHLLQAGRVVRIKKPGMFPMWKLAEEETGHECLANP